MNFIYAKRAASGFCRAAAILVLGLASRSVSGVGLDRNNNGLNDAWEMLFQGSSLAPNEDSDGDGFSNLAESRAGTNPLDPSSFPALQIATRGAGGSRLSWDRIPGKHYRILTSSNLFGGGWTEEITDTGDNPLPVSDTRYQFFRLAVDDVDSDGDGLNDYEERVLGLDPRSAHSERFQQTDMQRASTALAAANVINISAIDPRLNERWPDPGVVAFRRNGGIGPVTLHFAISGTATPGTDYSVSNTTNIYLPPGARETWLEFKPIADNDDSEPTETIIVTLLPGTGYTLGTNTTATLTLENQTATSGVGAKEAARFLIQAAFGPNQDSPDDPDDIPENVEEVMALGIEGWIDDQFTRPVGRIQPFVDWAIPQAAKLQLYGDIKEYSWWSRAMEVPKLRPDDTSTILTDPLRQRLAFALSQIMVVSDRLEDLAVEPRGMANYYDVLVNNAFGNYGDLLLEVALHPCMGLYLSDLGNKKADPVHQVYPDENFAREIMQLFTIGLWELNPDGTRKLDPEGQPIPTYDNHDITELARVFTGLAFGGTNANFGLWPRDFTQPMKMWDAYHDCDAKTLLGGLQLPSRTSSAGNQGLAGMADVRAAVANLFNHPNVGPFIGTQLIQRFVTSNPSPQYVSRVSAVFADNGQGVRGDLKAVIKAILLDPEARDGAKMSDPHFGKMREPFLRFVNFARAFNAASPSGLYILDQFDLDHMEEPMSAPSVFNFFMPNYRPPGALTEQNLLAPEFQIVNASSVIAAFNHYWNSILGDLHRWGAGSANYSVKLNLDQEMKMVVPANVISQDVPNVQPFDPDPLIRRLDLVLTGGQLSPRQFQIIRETLERLPRPNWQWHREYLRVAIYLVITSPEFSIMK
jgi:uncharacterized protein (DUF1800 family)